MENYNINNLVHVGTNYVLTRMQNIVWVTRGLGLSYMIEKDGGDMLAKIVQEVNPEKPLVVNFCRINEIDDHALDSFFDSVLATNRTVIILEGNHLFAKIETLKKGKSIPTTNDPGNRIIKIGTETNIDFDAIERERIELMKNFVTTSVKNCFEKFPEERRMSSTPILTNGEFNSNRLIYDVKTFMWLTTFMADELQKIINNCQKPQIKLLCASLRGAPFAASLAMLLKVPVDTIDHLGPKHKVFDKKFLSRLEKGTNYIFIGDFSIGGTEIKIAKTYTEFKSCNLNHALVIGNYIDSSHFKSDFELSALLDLKALGIATYKI